MISQRRLRLPAIGLVAAAAIAAMAGCSSDGNADSSSGGGHSDAELVVMSTYTPADYAGPAFAAAVKAFTEKTGIKVKSVTVGATDIYTTYESAKLAGQTPDVLIANLYDKALTWTENGATLPVTDYIKEWGLDKTINPAAVTDWTDSSGRVQALPFGGFTWPVWYNTAALTKAGVTAVPQTTDELIAAAAKLRAAGMQPVAIGGSDFSGEKFFLQIIQLMMSKDEAASVMSKGGYCASSSAMDGIDNFLKLSNAGVFIDNAEGLTADNMYASFNQGQAAIMPAGSWEFSQTPADLIPNITLGGFPLPQGSTFDKPVAYRAFTSSGIWLTDNGQARLDDFKAFVDYMYSPDVQKNFVKDAGVVPVTDVPNLADTISDQPLLLDAITELPATVDYGAFPDFSIPGDKTQVITSAISAAFAKGATSDAVCASLDAAYN